MKVNVSPLAEDLACEVARRLIGVCEQRQRVGEIPTLVLTGGTTARKVLEAMRSELPRAAVDWTRVRLFWGDERWVPRGHEDRNDRIADETILSGELFDSALVHRIPSSDAGMTIEAAAAVYATAIDEIAHIDVAINGVGEDGHVASIFPQSKFPPENEGSETSAVAVRNSPKPPAERVSLTLAALGRADRIWLFASGVQKAGIVAQMLSGAGAHLPAMRLRGTQETILWVDEDACSLTE